MPVTPWGAGHPANRGRDDRRPAFTGHLVHGGPCVVHRLFRQLAVDQQQQQQQWRRAPVHGAAASRRPAASATVSTAAAATARSVGRRGRCVRHGRLLSGHHDTDAKNAPRTSSPGSRRISGRRNARVGRGRRSRRPPSAPGRLAAAFRGQARGRRRGRRSKSHSGRQRPVGKIPQARHRNGHHQIRQVGRHCVLLLLYL